MFVSDKTDFLVKNCTLCHMRQRRSLCLQLISDICQLFLNKTGKNLYSGIEYKVRSTNMGNLKHTKILLCERYC